MRLTVQDHDSGADRPQRDQATVARNSPVGLVSAVLPDEPPIVDRQAVHTAVVRAHVDSLAVNRRRQPDWSFGEEGPLLLAGVQIETVHLVVGGRAKKDSLPVGHHVVRAIVGDTGLEPVAVVPEILLGRRRPGRSRCVGRPVRPDELQRQRQHVLGYARARGVVHIGGPVSPADAGAQGQNQNQQAGSEVATEW